MNQKRLLGYLKTIPKLRRHLKSNQFDIIHAHYSFCGVISTLAGAKPLIVSLMGSDIFSKGYFKLIIYIFSRLFWNSTIVKSEFMRQKINLDNVEIIPNGVDTTKFRPIPKQEALLESKWDPSRRHIFFAADPNRREKNFSLAESALKLIKTEHVELHYLKSITNEKMPYFYCSADIILLTSLWEGSPNVIKEAMSCNRPIVATNVGDIDELLKGVENSYVCSFDKYEIASKIDRLLEKDESSSGREKIERQYNESIIAKRIIRLYSETVV